MMDADPPITPNERRRLAVTLAVAALVTLACESAGCAAPMPGLQPADEHWEQFEGDHELATAETAAYVMTQQIKLWREMSADYPGVEAHVAWRPCGEVNGYYEPWSHNIVICAEALAHPGLAIQMAGHEFGHAITHQLRSTTDENAADELAIVEMARHGWYDEMLSAGMYIFKNWGGWNMGDPHPPGEFRGWELVCAESGAEGIEDPERPAPPLCDALYRGLVVKWFRLIPPAWTPPPWASDQLQ